MVRDDVIEEDGVAADRAEAQRWAEADGQRAGRNTPQLVDTRNLRAEPEPVAAAQRAC